MVRPMVYLRIELPVLGLSGRGATVLFDPIFGDKSLPSELLGPKRYTKPLKIENTPEVAAIVILVKPYGRPSLCCHRLTSSTLATLLSLTMLF
ncbi:hypothetical protein ARMGADRAFT_779157 [Armillaria gallica]|uniref:Uncharacterized protein n=1 Tax=Armillaria gallica TaxID=47427 RepID=A0A2H3CXK7_ARMGA|nr:hypothetical protein ARMGADRAFT_779157 [Armillaria gallica]